MTLPGIETANITIHRVICDKLLLSVHRPLLYLLHDVSANMPGVSYRILSPFFLLIFFCCFHPAAFAGTPTLGHSATRCWHPLWLNAALSFYIPYIIRYGILFARPGFQGGRGQLSCCVFYEAKLKCR